jgi:hypothetical protein
MKNYCRDSVSLQIGISRPRFVRKYAIALLPTRMNPAAAPSHSSAGPSTKLPIITSVRPMSKATLNQSSKPLIHRIRKSAKTRIGRQFAGACTSPIEIFAAKGGFSPWAAIPPAVPGTYRRSGGSALLIAFHVARTNSSREANCLGSMGGWKTSVAVPPFISDVPLGIIS